MAKNQDLRTALAQKTWIGFDLDDTLHEFRRAAGTATTDVLHFISRLYDADVGALHAQYARILKDKTSNAFSDGKTSEEYRSDRFTSLLHSMSLPQRSSVMEEILLRYRTTLASSLELKPGAMELISTLKSMGKKITIVTEGPQDAQEWTLRELGLLPLVDALVASSAFKASKVDGLFGKVLDHLNVDGNDVAFVGDNYERDVIPAQQAGMLAVYYTEDDGAVEERGHILKVAALWQLRSVFTEMNG